MPTARELADRLDGADSLVVVCHDNPDPDCIASALALETIAESAGVTDVDVVYGGDISHQQNRTFVNLLDVDLVPLADVDLSAYDLTAFVDHSGQNAVGGFPTGAGVDVVVDHHPSTERVEAGFVDVREEYGATASILVEYLRDLSVEPDSRLASALLFALHRERLDFVRHPTRHEYEAALHVYTSADLSILEQLYSSAFSPATLDAIGEAIRRREIRGSSLVSGIGRTTERDALPQAADYLLNLEGVDTVLVFGVVDGTVHLSARSIDPRVHVGETLREAFGDVGAAGGHQDMAGAQIPLGIFADRADDDDDDLVRFVSRRVVDRFFDAMNLEDEDEEEADAEEANETGGG